MESGRGGGSLPRERLGRREGSELEPAPRRGDPGRFSLACSLRSASASAAAGLAGVGEGAGRPRWGGPLRRPLGSFAAAGTVTRASGRSAARRREVSWAVGSAPPR